MNKESILTAAEIESAMKYFESHPESRDELKLRCDTPDYFKLEAEIEKGRLINIAQYYKELQKSEGKYIASNNYSCDNNYSVGNGNGCGKGSATGKGYGDNTGFGYGNKFSEGYGFNDGSSSCLADGKNNGEEMQEWGSNNAKLGR